MPIDDPELRKAYYRERYHKNRRKAIDYLGGVCADCGTTENLTFDHADASTKEYDVSRQLLNGQSWDRLQAELDKCVLRCVPCHARKSTACGDNHAVEHGGGLTGKKNCRCELCGARKNEYMRNWRQARRGL